MKSRVHIDVSKLAKAMRDHVVAKAAQFGSTIIYKQGDALIEENPCTAEKRVIKPRLNVR